MLNITEPLPWNMQPNTPFVPISHQGEVVGFCKPGVAAQIVEALNENDRLQKALLLACRDLAAADPRLSAEERTQQYIAQAERPKSGTRVIARLLQERQEELDVTDEEFAKFCDSFRLSREELRNICTGEPIEEPQFGPLSRILGRTVPDLMNVWKGSASATQQTAS